MSAISTAYDALVAQIVSLFPNHIELVNPYIPEANDDLTSDAAFGVGFTEGENTQREFGCNYTVRRNFIVTLTRKIYRGDQNRTATSITERRDTEKQIFEDLHLLIKAVETNVVLNAQGANDIAWCLYRADSGLEFLRVENVNLIMVRAIFEIEYFERLNN